MNPAAAVVTLAKQTRIVTRRIRFYAVIRFCPREPNLPAVHLLTVAQ